MAGTLYLIPSALGERPWTDYLPAATQAVACRLRRFVVENAKTTRAELKRLGHPLPLRDLAIEQLSERLSPDEIGRRAHALGIAVKPLVGPSSLLLALMASGLEGQRFAFHGYLPAREPDRQRRIVELEGESSRLDQTQIFIEAPYRNDALLAALLAACQPATRLCLATDLTTAEETITTRAIGDWRRLTLPKLDRQPTVFLMLG